MKDNKLLGIKIEGFQIHLYEQKLVLIKTGGVNSASLSDSDSFFITDIILISFNFSSIILINPLYPLLKCNFITILVYLEAQKMY